MMIREICSSFHSTERVSWRNNGTRFPKSLFFLKLSRLARNASKLFVVGAQVVNRIRHQNKDPCSRFPLGIGDFFCFFA